MYVDEFIPGGIKSKQYIRKELFKKGGFSLHNWNSDLATSESENNKTEDELTYVEQMLIQVLRNNKILSLECNKETDKVINSYP